MKHKLTVLACVGLALLLSTGYTFAQSSSGVGEADGLEGSATLPRCAAVDIPIFLNISQNMGAWGLPLTITEATLNSVTESAAVLAQPQHGFGPLPLGTVVVLNFAGGCLPSGNYPDLWTLNMTTSDACTGKVIVDTAFVFPAGAFVTLDCTGAPMANFNWFKGEWDLKNQDPVCLTNPNHSITWLGAISQQLVGDDPDVCDVASLTFQLGDLGGLSNGAISSSGLFTYTGDCADKGTHTVKFTVTDQCGDVSPDCEFTVEVTNDVPTCGTNTHPPLYWQSQIVDFPLNAGPSLDPLTFSFVSIVPPLVGGPTSGVSVTSDGKLNMIVECDDAITNYTVTFRVSDGCDSVDCTIDILVFQDAPVCQDPANETVNWRTIPPLAVTLIATDDGCHCPLFWTILDEIPQPVNGGTIQGNQYIFDPDCLDVGKTITVRVVVDDCELRDTCSFTVTVINPPPTITCPDDIDLAILGDLVEAQASASDQYGDPLTYSIISFESLHDPGRRPTNDITSPITPGGPAIDPITGEFSWQTVVTPDQNDDGLWEVCLEVADGCDSTDTCCFTIDVLSYLLCITDAPPLSPAKTHVGPDTIINVLNGQIATVYVWLSNNYPVGGLDLLICYDQSGLSFIDAQAVGQLANWEYFTYRHSAQSNCAGGCPTGYLRIVAIADLDNGPNTHPTYPDDFLLHGQIAAINFYVTSDRNFIHSCFNVGFCTIDCGDNAISSVSGDTTFVPIGSDISCIDTTKETARDIIRLCWGRICIDEPPDDRGDINLNGIANEVGDAVLYTNYFIYGPSVWTSPYEDVQILASDVNNDGIVLTVADLIYLIRISTGDEQPFPPGGFPKLSPYANSGSVSYRVENGAMTVSTSSSVDLGGALMVFRYSDMGVGTPTLASAASGLTLTSSARNGELRVLLSTNPNAAEMASVQAGTHELFTVPVKGAGRIELVETQMSDAQGALMSTTAASASIPQSYALLQNYPNPFNAGTVIPFDLKNEGDWSLAVYNVAGQSVRTFSGHDAAGQVQVSWDGRDEQGRTAASGVYFYRIVSGDFAATKKMILLK